MRLAIYLFTKANMKMIISFLLSIFLAGCDQVQNQLAAVNESLINAEAGTLSGRIKTPSGFTRNACDTTSFTNYLRNLKLKPDGSNVKLYSGEDKPWQYVHAAVVDMEIGTKDLQQCADACIRLRAEYLWSQKEYDKIHFNLTNGFRMDYSKWRDGNRLKVDGNKTWWEKTAEPSTSYQTFRNYLDKVFMYAGTLSIEKELKAVELENLEAGDVFVIGGSPGHAAMVADVAADEQGNKIFLLVQGYMPAQEIHIIKNPNDESISPWFRGDFEGALETMEWTFPSYKLGRF